MNIIDAKPHVYMVLGNIISLSGRSSSFRKYVCAESPTIVLNFFEKELPSLKINSISHKGTVDLYIGTDEDKLDNFWSVRYNRIRANISGTFSETISVLSNTLENAIAVVKKNLPDVKLFSVNHIGPVEYVISFTPTKPIDTQ